MSLAFSMRGGEREIKGACVHDQTHAWFERLNREAHLPRGRQQKREMVIEIPRLVDFVVLTTKRESTRSIRSKEEKIMCSR